MTREQMARELVRHLPTEARKKFAEAVIRKRDDMLAGYAAVFIKAVALTPGIDPSHLSAEVDDYSRAADVLLRILEEPA